jgi:5'-nucleotidase
MLDPQWGVDMILGGHSHSYMEKPEKVNNILIAHSGTGSNQIGRFDIEVDDNTNSIVDYRWELVQIDDSIVEPDKDLEKYIGSYQEQVDRKYNTIVTKLADKLTHPKREIETSLGNLIADAFGEISGCDVMLVGAGSIRSKELGPVVTLKDLRTCFPYDETLTRFTISGADIKGIFEHIMRPENRNGEGECYEINEGVRAVYHDGLRRLVSLTIKGEPVNPERMYSICIPGFHLNNADRYLGISQARLQESGKTRVVTTSAMQVLEEYMRNHQNVKKAVEGRLTYIGKV